ncbi:hypothetical protein TNCV_4415631 [Trichonephila clavipes]|uniref:Uncharacterized protein n=1 Tax=Trichonephila clavipes TaxID=2585209 RepID=A0A8X6VFU1_TRICX|nr:hypothetical protein TNCV_4415631 [Trichonephila clavipes]
MWACIILLKDSFTDALKEGNDFGLLHFTDVPVAFEITLNSWQIGLPMIRNRTPKHKSESDVDEADISTPVAVYQRAANYLEKSVRSFTAGVDRHALTLPFVVSCQFLELFGARRSTASKLASLWNCSAAHELLLCDRKILLKGR